MTELVIRNKEILRKLDHILTEVKKSKILFNKEETDKLRFYAPSDAPLRGEHYVSEEYFRNFAISNPKHKGFPVEHMSLPIDRITSAEEPVAAINEYVRADFVSELGANANALFNYYPPGGFVGWHTNENNSGHQFLFTWSQDGDGYFRYYDKQKDEIVHIPDVPGWQCRHYHFGQDEPDHCWHAAYTNSPRITVCVLFRWWDFPENKDMILGMKDDLIEEIQSEV